MGNQSSNPATDHLSESSSSVRNLNGGDTNQQVPSTAASVSSSRMPPLSVRQPDNNMKDMGGSPHKSTSKSTSAVSTRVPSRHQTALSSSPSSPQSAGGSRRLPPIRDIHYSRLGVLPTVKLSAPAYSSGRQVKRSLPVSPTHKINQPCKVRIGRVDKSAAAAAFITVSQLPVVTRVTGPEKATVPTEPSSNDSSKGQKRERQRPSEEHDCEEEEEPPRQQRRTAAEEGEKRSVEADQQQQDEHDGSMAAKRRRRTSGQIAVLNDTLNSFKEPMGSEVVTSSNSITTDLTDETRKSDISVTVEDEQARQPVPKKKDGHKRSALASSLSSSLRSRLAGNCSTAQLDEPLYKRSARLSFLTGHLNSGGSSRGSPVHNLYYEDLSESGSRVSVTPLASVKNSPRSTPLPPPVSISGSRLDKPPSAVTQIVFPKTEQPLTGFVATLEDRLHDEGRNEVRLNRLLGVQDSTDSVSSVSNQQLLKSNTSSKVVMPIMEPKIPINVLPVGEEFKQTAPAASTTALSADHTPSSGAQPPPPAYQPPSQLTSHDSTSSTAAGSGVPVYSAARGLTTSTAGVSSPSASAERALATTVVMSSSPLLLTTVSAASLSSNTGVDTSLKPKGLSSQSVLSGPTGHSVVTFATSTTGTAANSSASAFASSAGAKAATSTAAPQFDFGSQVKSSIPAGNSSFSASSSRSEPGFTFGAVTSTTATTCTSSTSSSLVGSLTSTAAAFSSTFAGMSSAKPNFTFGSTSSAPHAAAAVSDGGLSTFGVTASTSSTNFSSTPKSTNVTPTSGSPAGAGSAGSVFARLGSGSTPFGSTSTNKDTTMLTYGTISNNIISSTQPVFGSTMNSSTGPVFGSTTTASAKPDLSSTSTSSVGPVFGSNTTTFAKPAFGSTQTSSVGPVFGSATSTSAGPLFGSTSTSSVGPVFGSNTTTSAKPVFGSTQTSSVGPVFGAATSTSAGPLFGSTSTSSVGPVFGSNTTTSAKPVFGSTQASSVGSVFGLSSAGLAFGSTTTTSAGPAFGSNGAPPITSPPPFQFGTLSTTVNSNTNNSITPSGVFDGSSTAFGSAAFTKLPAAAGFNFGSSAAPPSTTFTFGAANPSGVSAPGPFGAQPTPFTAGGSSSGGMFSIGSSSSRPNAAPRGGRKTKGR